MAPKAKLEAKEKTSAKKKGKLENFKDSEIEPVLNIEVPLPWVNPLPLVRAKEDFTPLGEGEHQFVSILNADGNPSTFTRLQKTESILDDPHRPPFVVEHYKGSSCDCYFKDELVCRQDLCELCEEIWRHWNWKHCPPPPKEIDPYANFLCVGDIDPHFQPTRGDMIIFHPSGPQSLVGLRAKWGNVLSYQGQRNLEFHPHDLVVRLGSFLSSTNVVDYIPYNKVEVQAMTKNTQWRFLGGQVALAHNPPVKALSPIQQGPPLEKKDSQKNKKGKKDKQDIKKKESQELGETKNTSNKKKGGKEKKSSKKDSEQAKDIQIGVLPEFTLDDIPNLFNIIPKAPDPFAPHPGEIISKSHRGSMTCNYRYNRPGMQCGMGEFLPQLGDIIISEPHAWMHDEWGDKKKRPKGSMVKWYKPAPWKRELKQGMLLLRPHIDRFTQMLDNIPQCEYTLLMWSQWGHVELYLYEGRLSPIVGSSKIDGELMKIEGDQTDNNTNKKIIKAGKKLKKGEKASEDVDQAATDVNKEKPKDKQGKRKEQKALADTKLSKNGKKYVEGNKKSLEENTGESDQEPMDENLWKYWGRSTHFFDEPFQFWAVDKFCRKRHLKGVQNLEHLDFFVEDTGVESDLEHAPKVEEVPFVSEPQKKKTKEEGDKSKEKKDKQTKEEGTKKQKKT